ncbi:MAG TPA: hypothetical protein PLH43_12880 [Acetivibrio sp.]|nr:hypothetical protein [Acetivibrio sp.]
MCQVILTISNHHDVLGAAGEAAEHFKDFLIVSPKTIVSKNFQKDIVRQAVKFL